MRRRIFKILEFCDLDKHSFILQTSECYFWSLALLAFSPVLKVNLFHILMLNDFTLKNVVNFFLFVFCSLIFIFLSLMFFF